MRGTLVALAAWILAAAVAVTAHAQSDAVQPPLPSLSSPETARNTTDKSLLSTTGQLSEGSVRQGGTLKVSYRPSEGTEPAQAVFAGRKVPLFRQATGEYLGLVPVSVVQPVGSLPLKILDKAGQIIAQQPVTVKNAWFKKQNIAVSKEVKGLEPLPGEMEAIQALKDTVTSVRYWQEPFRQPVPDCMNSAFGNLRYHNGVFSGNYHKGLDQRAPAGRPIRAIAGGRVRIATMYRLHGGTVGLDHGQGVSSIYIHQSKIAVKAGDVVQQGDIIGYVGSTGFATGPHLHWGLYVNGLPVNPQQWVTVSPCG
jgi:hypothetical protein